MAHTQDLHAELISVPAATPGTGTVTSVHVTSPLTGGGPGPVVNIGIQQFDSTHAGYVPLSDGSAQKFLAADGTFKAVTDTDAFVTLQAATPGVPDTGNFHISGTGIIDHSLIVTAANNVTAIDGTATGVGAGVSAHAENGSAILASATGNGFGVNALVASGIAIQAASTSGTSGYFQSFDPGNTQPTLVVQQESTGVSAADLITVFGGGLGPVLFQVGAPNTSNNGLVTITNATANTAFYVASSSAVPAGIGVDVTPGTGNAGFGIQSSITELGIGIQTTSAGGDALQALSASAISGFFQSANAANTSATVVIEQNSTAAAPLLSLRSQSAADAAVASRLSFSDTNAAATLGNAVIGLQTVNISAPDLLFYTSGSDNDTPGTEMLRILGTPQAGFSGSIMIDTGSLGVNTFPAVANASRLHVYDAAADTTLITVENDAVGGSGHGYSGISLLGPGLAMTIFVDQANFAHFRQASGGSLTGPDLLTFDLNNHVITQGDTGGSMWTILDNNNGTFTISGGSNLLVVDSFGNQGLSGKLAVGSTTIGTHALDVTGDAAVTTNFTANAYFVGATAGISFSGAITNLTVVNGIVTAAS